MNAWWLPYAALILQLPLPLLIALAGIVPGLRPPGSAALYAALAGAGLGLVYAAMTRDVVFATAEAFAAAAFVGLYRKKHSFLNN